MRCSQNSVITGLSVVSGVVAVGLLLCTIMMTSWVKVLIHDEVKHQKEVPKCLLDQKMDCDYDHSGEEPEIFSAATEGMPFIESGHIYTVRRSVDISVWKVCISTDFIRWRKESYSFVIAGESNFETKCLQFLPFLPEKVDHDEEEPVLNLFLTSKDFIKDPYFIYPLFTSVGLIVIALLVASGGMAMNNIATLVGAAFYEISSLVLAISVFWFFNTVYYTRVFQSSFQLSQMHINPRRYMLASLKSYHTFGPGFIIGPLVFLIINMAAACAIATYRISTRKATRKTLFRKERELMRSVEPHEMVTRL